MSIVAEDLRGVVEPNFRPVEQPVGLGQGPDCIEREIALLKRHQIDTAGPSRITFGEHVGGHVVADGAHRGHGGVAADRNQRMDDHRSPQRCRVEDADAFSQKRPVADGDVVVEEAVVGDKGPDMNRLWLPTRVTPVARSLARLIVKFSRMML